MGKEPIFKDFSMISHDFPSFSITFESFSISFQACEEKARLPAPVPRTPLLSARGDARFSPESEGYARRRSYHEQYESRPAGRSRYGESCR